MAIRLLAVSFWLSFLTTISINPERIYKFRPADLGIESYKELKLTTSDGLGIKVWDFVPSKVVKKQLLILVGGDAGNMGYELSYVKDLLNRGFAVITFDYRGFGGSDEFAADHSYLYLNEYHLDLDTVVDYAARHYSNDYSIGLLAFSMGKIASVQNIATSSKLDFFIAEDLVVSLREVQSRLLELKNVIVKLPEPIDSHQNLVTGLNIPTLLISSRNDKITRATDCTLVKTANQNIRKIVIHDGDHGQGLVALTERRLGDLYFQEITAFLGGL